MVYILATVAADVSSMPKSKIVLSVMSYGITFFSSADSIVSFLHII